MSAVLVVTARLMVHGWKILGVDHTGIACKTYPTAVGPKEAVIYLSRGDGLNRTLSGSYWSEGRNILESGMLIPEGAEVQLIETITDVWAKEVDRRVHESYAARLLRK